jgi:hypothetical protein
VEAAKGSAVTAGQQSAIAAFVTAGKADGWYNYLSRFYFPIWANEAANAIDLVTRASGSFPVGGVTHSSGYMAGNGTTGYFNTGFNPVTGGLTTGSAWLGSLSWSNSSNFQNGAYTTGGTTLLLYGTSGPTIRSEICGSTRRYDSSVASNSARDGIFSSNRRSGVTRHRLLRTSGITVSEDFTAADAGTMPNGNFYWLARNRIDTSSVDQSTAGNYGAMWLGNGVADTLDESFCASLKTLWETCTGLTLP